MGSIQKLLAKLYNGNNRLTLLDQRYLPRWVVVVLDVLLCTLSLALVYYIYLGTPVFFSGAISVPTQALLLIGVNLFYFFLFKTYSGIIRHSTFTDIVKLALSSSATGISLMVFTFAYGYFTGNMVYPLPTLLLYMLLSFTALLLFRVLVKETYQFIKKGTKGVIKKRVAIVGADDQTISIGKALITESDLPFKLVGFLTKTFSSKRYKVLGKPVIPIQDNFEGAIKNLDLEGILMVSGSLAAKEKNEIAEHCLKAGIEIYHVPIMEKWNSTKDIKTQIKPIQIEDLLQRSPIKTDTTTIGENLRDKTILITGGAGSIGSEIVRQICKFGPKLLVVLDQAETPLHQMDMQLKET
ncbi:MAG: polysaccharide biosynthesis protein, partial [Marinirhabdus sp.]